MKIIENYCNQPRPYADSTGWLRIELEDGDDKSKIIEEYEHIKRDPLDYSCVFKPGLSSEKVLVFKRDEPFLD